MKTIAKIEAKNGKKFIEIIEETDGVFSLKKFAIRFDSEEEVEYTIRELPDPPSKFMDLEVAKKEAARIMQLSAT